MLNRAEDCPSHSTEEAEAVKNQLTPGSNKVSLGNYHLISLS